MISACMTVSVRELRTAVREWACCRANNELYIKLRTQVTSRVPYCCVRDKTFTCLTIVKHVESSFENPYTI